jgi:polysaccharide pyruvyl transferase CsaB
LLRRAWCAGAYIIGRDVATGSHRIVLAGYYGFGNAGDEAILASLLAGLRSRDPGIRATVLSGNPAVTVATHGVSAVAWPDLEGLSNAIEDSDIVVVGGGGLFHDYWGVDPDTLLTDRGWGIPSYAAPVLLAALHGTPALIVGVGVGPLGSVAGRELTRQICDLAEGVTVRDVASAQLLAAIGVARGRVEVTADPAFTFTPTASDRERAAQRVPEGDGPLVALALRPWDVGVNAPRWEGEVAAAADLLVRAAGARILFVPLQDLPSAKENDAAVAERVAGRMIAGHRAHLVRSPLGAGETAALLARCDAVVGMRLHALIFALGGGVPAVALSYDPKVDATMSALGLEQETIRLADLERTSLASAVTTALEGREVLGRRLGPLLEKTRAAAAKNVDRIWERLQQPSARFAPRAGQELFVRGIRAQIRGIASARAAAETDRSRIARLEGDAALLREQRVKTAEAHRRMAEDAALLQEQLAMARSETIEALRRLAESAAMKGENVRLVEALDKTRREVHAWKAAHDDARASFEGVREELRRWHASRLFRTGTFYWRLLRMLTGRPSGSAQVVATSPPGRSHDVPGSTPEPLAVRPEPARRPERPSGVEPLPRGTYDVLVFPIIDWEFRFQRPQQLASQFGRKGHRVLYLSASRFLPEKGPAWQTVRQAENVTEVRIRSARALDIYGGKLEERDLDVLEESFSVLARDLAIADAVCKVDIPFWTPLVLRLRERFGWRVVYDCMDEWNNFPGFKEPVLAAEPTLVREADVTLVSADRLLAKWSNAARPLMVRNAVDLDHYTRLYRPNGLLGDVAHPVIGYYGALASWVDVPLLRKVAEAFPDGTIVLAGGQFDVDLGPIAQLTNVRLLGQRPYEEMPLLLWHFDACIIPFLVNAITEATNPVKFYEYISQGKPVVAPDLTELRPFSEVCYLARDHEDFVAKLRLALDEAPDDPRRRKRQEIAVGNDWSARVDTIDAAVRHSFPPVSVVVITYDGLDLTKACLRSLLSAETWPRLEVIVVDNGSSDGTPAFLEELAGTDARVKTILNATNRGFAAANNQGIAASAGEIVVLLNNDTVVPQGLLGRLAAHLQRDAGLGMVCPTTNFCGNEAKVDPDYSDLADLPAYAARRAAENAGVVFDIPIAAMYCVAFRREVLEKVGPLDEAFRIGMFEDDDYALRIRDAGLRVVCAEDAYVHHVGQGSFGKLPREEYERLFRENRATFERKWGRPWKPHRVRDGTSSAVSRIE